MKPKRFIDTSILPKNFRKLKCELKLSWFYLWNNCDEAGVYEIDEDLFEFENGFKLNTNELLNAFNGLLDYLNAKILIKDFIRINNGEIKEGYNPHKPVIRSMEQNNIKLNITLNQAYFKLGDGDRDRGVEGEEEVGRGKNKKDDNFLETELYPTFDDFWNEYDKKVGKKEKIEKKWDKLSQGVKEHIMGYIPDYKLSQPDKQYRKNPETFLNNKSWNDEIIKPNEKQSNNNQQGASDDFRRKTAQRLGFIQP